MKDNKLLLWCGYSYSSPNTEYIRYIKKLISVILYNKKPSMAKECESLYFKYYKNGRLDIEFRTENPKEDADKVAEYLVKDGNKNEN